MYIPPFEISTNAINCIAEISRLTERYAIRLEAADGLRLRKANRIRTIHSSLAIEGNTLSVDEELDEVPNKVPNKIPNKAEYPDISDSTWNIYVQLKKNPHASATEISGKAGMSDRMVRKHLAVLKDAGIIERSGSNKTGYWIILK